MALHFTNVSLNDHVESIDPHRGEAIYGEHWVLFDADGEPTESRSEFRLSDGTLVQSHHLSADGGHVEGITAGGTNDPNEVAISREVAIEALQALIPRVGLVTRFESRGFAEVDRSDVRLRADRTGIAVAHLSFVPGSQRHFVIEQDRGAGYMREESLSVDTISGVLVSSLVVGRDPSGTEVYRTEINLGIVELVQPEHSPFQTAESGSN